ncbi:MAG: biotin/lipoate A/B protein ligase family protein, partial [Paludibacteraceae bacterium]
MLYIPAPEGKRLVWYLSMEEYLAQHATEDVFFSWVVAPTVIFGRHQVMEAEVNMPYCQSHGVQMYRRKSGGGCVYSDEGNMMLSYITPNTHSEQVFQWYLDTVADALRGMGFPAAKTEHNDVLIGDRKVSGNACYALPTGTIVHG